MVICNRDMHEKCSRLKLQLLDRNEEYDASPHPANFMTSVMSPALRWRTVFLKSMLAFRSQARFRSSILDSGSCIPVPIQVGPELFLLLLYVRLHLGRRHLPGRVSSLLPLPILMFHGGCCNRCIRDAIAHVSLAFAG